MGIDRDMFFVALEQSANNPVHHRITQQILSVDDFESFKRMMIKKNMQINEIAMNELMKNEAGDDNPRDSQQPEDNQNDEDEQMRLAMEMSKVQMSEADKMAAEEEEMIRLAIEASQKEEEERVR